MQVLRFKLRIVVVPAMVASLCGPSLSLAESRQEHIHEHSGDVMPFDMAATIHIFRMTESGGLQKVRVRDDADDKQVSLIREHLRQEAERFGQGDFSDPGELHGADMPGLAKLRQNPQALDVAYTEMPGGAQLEFMTEDHALVTAIHRWFGAQLSDHGADARAE